MIHNENGVDASVGARLLLESGLLNGGAVFPFYKNLMESN